MVLKKKRCRHPGCSETKQPFYGYEDNDWERCEAHKLPDMIRLDAQCMEQNCQYLPEWSFGQNEARFCEFHKTARMLFKVGCLASGCEGPRMYGYSDGALQLCDLHKATGMVVGAAEAGEFEQSLDNTLKHGFVSQEQEVELNQNPSHKHKTKTSVKQRKRKRIRPLEEQQRAISFPKEYNTTEGCFRPDAYGLQDEISLYGGSHSDEGTSLKKSEEQIKTRSVELVDEGCMQEYSSYFGCRDGFYEAVKTVCFEQYPENSPKAEFVQDQEHMFSLLDSSDLLGFEEKDPGGTFQKNLTFPASEQDFVTMSNPFEVAQKHSENSMKLNYTETNSTKQANQNVNEKCEIFGCKKNARFGYDSTPRFCRSHKLENMIKLAPLQKVFSYELCKHPNCHEKAAFTSGKDEHFCAKHRSKGMAYQKHVSNNSLHCQSALCTNQASYGYNDGPPAACKHHKAQNMIFQARSETQSKRRSVCESSECLKRAVFGFVGDKLRMCSAHSLEGMYWCGRPPQEKSLCKISYCGKTAFFGFEDGTQEYCSKHKLPGMLFKCKKPVLKTCMEEGCMKEPLYAFPKKRGPKFCSLHKKEGMILPELTCKHEDDCPRKAYYGYREAPNLRCKIHKLPGMFCFKPMTLTKLCKYPDCDTVPSYGDDDDPRAFCVLHKSPDMIHVDKRKSCENVDCQRHPYYGFPGGKTRFCSTHKLDGMEARHGRKRCEFEGCLKPPSYGFQGKVRQFCALHKHPSMTRTSVCQYGDCKKYPHYGAPGQSIREYCEDHRPGWMVFHPKPAKGSTSIEQEIAMLPPRRGRPPSKHKFSIHQSSSQSLRSQQRHRKEVCSSTQYYNHEHVFFSEQQMQHHNLHNYYHSHGFHLQSEMI